MAARSYLLPVWEHRRETENKRYDVIVIGAGIAGMTAALSLDPGLKVALVSKESIVESSTYKAQGGMAVAVGDDDSVGTHVEDTLRVGQGACRGDAVTVLAAEGPQGLEFLQSLGADFCRNEKGLDLTREAAHSRNRVVHYYDFTGNHIAEVLAAEVGRRHNIERLENSFLVDILTGTQGCCGCVIEQGDRLLAFRAAAVVVASGGYSGLFNRSTNEVSSSGDGIAAAYRAGAVISDMEFVQFHPTTYTTLSGKVFLLTEALRGEGAVLLNSAGERFMFRYHAGGELAPRDEVSRAILTETGRRGGGLVYLDARHLGKRYLSDRFRQVYAELAKNGCYMEKSAVPVAPAAHYTIGGIKSDVWGRTTVPRLYACGEAAATGVHGANRLASNSLLEGVVFGRRAAESINGSSMGSGAPLRLSEGAVMKTGGSGTLKELRTRLDSAAGVVRSGTGLNAALQWLGEVKATGDAEWSKNDDFHVRNAYQLAGLLLEAALLRPESRGSHYRSDFPGKNGTSEGKHTLQQWEMEAMMA